MFALIHCISCIIRQKKDEERINYETENKQNLGMFNCRDESLTINAETGTKV